MAIAHLHIVFPLSLCEETRARSWLAVGVVCIHVYTSVVAAFPVTEHVQTASLIVLRAPPPSASKTYGRMTVSTQMRASLHFRMLRAVVCLLKAAHGYQGAIRRLAVRPHAYHRAALRKHAWPAVAHARRNLLVQMHLLLYACVFHIVVCLPVTAQSSRVARLSRSVPYAFYIFGRGAELA